MDIVENKIGSLWRETKKQFDLAAKSIQENKDQTKRLEGRIDKVIQSSTKNAKTIQQINKQTKTLEAKMDNSIR